MCQQPTAMHSFLPVTRSFLFPFWNSTQASPFPPLRKRSKGPSHFSLGEWAILWLRSPRTTDRRHHSTLRTVSPFLLRGRMMKTIFSFQALTTYSDKFTCMLCFGIQTLFLPLQTLKDSTWSFILHWVGKTRHTIEDLGNWLALSKCFPCFLIYQMRTTIGPIT